MPASYARQPFWTETSRLDYTRMSTLTHYGDLPPDNPMNDGFKVAVAVGCGTSVINLREAVHWTRMIIWNAGLSLSPLASRAHRMPITLIKSANYNMCNFASYVSKLLWIIADWIIIDLMVLFLSNKNHNGES